MALLSTLKSLLRTASLVSGLLLVAPAHAALIDFDFSAPGTANASLGLNPVFSPVDDFGTGINVAASAFAPVSGQLEVHRNRNNGLGVTGARNDPFANRINSHNASGLGTGDDMETLRLTFSVPVQLLSITFRAVGARSGFVLLANPDQPLSSPIVGTPTNGEAVDMSSFGLTGTSFDVSAGGLGQSLRVHSLRAAATALAFRSTSNTVEAPEPATWALALLGFAAVSWRRRMTKSA